MEVNVAALQYAYLNLVYRLFLTKLLLEIAKSAQTTEATPPEPNPTQGERYRYITDDNHTQGERYRYITDGNDALGTHTATGESTGTTRYTGINVTLYGRGEAVAMNYSASTGSRGGAAYLGKDILGSVRSTSNEYGLLEGRYEYDAFGKPYKGELSAGMNLGYTGKPYDATTGLYNYGYRDYQPANAGFTTVDPIRDGNNWVAYVNNDPINWVDLWGLDMEYGYNNGKGTIIVSSVPTNSNGSIDYAGIKMSMISVPQNPSYTWPSDSGRITTVSGQRDSFSTTNGVSSTTHPGIDIAPPIPGTKGQSIQSIELGVVTSVTYNNRTYGNTVTVTDAWGYTEKYSHLDAINVTKGQVVYQNTQIGTMGATGNVSGVHLDFEIRGPNGKAVDPLSVLPERPSSITINSQTVVTDPVTGVLSNYRESQQPQGQQQSQGQQNGGLKGK